MRLTCSLLLLNIACLSMAACGGGSSGGSGFSGSIALVSITFPKTIDSMVCYDAPPLDAPLSQQIVFTFSGPVEGPVTSSSLFITADPGPAYNGPLVLFDPEKNLVKAAGTFKANGSRVVFTPNLPMKKMDLQNPFAGEDELPGLLPGMTYDIFVPIGTTGAIANLAGVDPTVKNPQSFTTGKALYFKNFPLEPPSVASTQPADGRIDFPVNNLKMMAALEPFEGVEIGFDQPLDPCPENLLGVDGNGDGIRESNLYLRFSEKFLFASSRLSKGLFRLNREKPDQDPSGTFKPTLYECVSTPLRDVAFGINGDLVGLSDGVLYALPYETGDPAIELAALIDTGYPGLKGLASTPEGILYSMDLDSSRLMRIDPDTGEVHDMGYVPGGDEARDLACRANGALYLLRLEGVGTPYPMSYLDRIDPMNASLLPVTSMPGAFDSMVFVSFDTLYLHSNEQESLWMLDVDTAHLHEVGKTLSPWNGELDLAALFYEMETDPVVLENRADGCTLSINPMGMLPSCAKVEIMVRNRFGNIRGWSLFDEDEEKWPALASYCSASFTTRDLGSEPVDDEFIEDFNDHLFESFDHALASASAEWNFQDMDGSHPHYEHLLATFGHGGSGELGDFKPTVYHPYVVLDTNYQPLPLLDGSTPDVIDPIVVKGGRFDFRSIHIPENVILSAHGSNPLVLTATQEVLIEGTIDVSGSPGWDEVCFDSGFFPLPGGPGGPGGGRGGDGHPSVPPDFQALSKLHTPSRGGDGRDPSDLLTIGGRGGETGATYDFANQKGVPYKGGYGHGESRGAGGGGGTMLWMGRPGRDGLCNYVPDHRGMKVAKDKTVGGDAGNVVFTDGNPDNNFFGPSGEMAELHGGQGGGAGGSRWDSLNPDCVNKTPPGYPICMWDARGGGGGGGGGALAIHALGTIRITKTGMILARGGRGGGGEQVGVSNFAGGGGGGSGGAVILQSCNEIIMEEETAPYPNPDYKIKENCGAVIDVSGGMMADAMWKSVFVNNAPDEFCPMFKKPKLDFCIMSEGDGGQGGFGLIQLMTDDPAQDIVPSPDMIADAGVWVGARIFTTDPLEFPAPSLDMPYYQRHYLTYESDPSAYPKVYQWGNDPLDPAHKVHVNAPPLVDPWRTKSFISPVSYGLSKWIDFTGTAGRNLVLGDPGMPVPLFSSFRGTDPATGVVITENGFVKNYHLKDYNDVAVSAPDLGIDHYIPEDNEVAVEFQGARALSPGLHVPGEDTSDWTADITSLSGYPFIRFRIRLVTSKSGNLDLSNARPQIDRLRIRAAY